MSEAEYRAMRATRGTGCDRQIGDVVYFSDLELIALLFVPLAMLEGMPFDTTEAIAALAQADALISGQRRDKEYARYRDAFVRGLAHLARLPGGVRFGRLHFGNDNEWTITI